MPPCGRGVLSASTLGRHYELATLSFLSSAPFYLFGLLHSANGRQGDKGVDLRGFWDSGFAKACSTAAARGELLPTLPPPPPRDGGGRRRWDVVVQCKRWTTRQVGPDVVRELEGTAQRAARRPSQPRAPAAPQAPSPRPVLAILASLSGFTPGALDRAAQSATPLLLLHLPKVEPPIAGGAGCDDGRRVAEEVERYEPRRIEMNRAFREVVEEEAWQVVERVSIGREETKPVMQWLQGA